MRAVGLNAVATMLRQKFDMAPYPFPDAHTPLNTPEDQSPGHLNAQVVLAI